MTPRYEKCLRYEQYFIIRPNTVCCINLMIASEAKTKLSLHMIFIWEFYMMRISFFVVIPTYLLVIWVWTYSKRHGTVIVFSFYTCRTWSGNFYKNLLTKQDVYACPNLQNYTNINGMRVRYCSIIRLYHTYTTHTPHTNTTHTHHSTPTHLSRTCHKI